MTVRNSTTGDQIAEMIPWSNLAWLQVHPGHLPLWNPYNGLGLPLAFNWQSAVSSACRWWSAMPSRSTSPTPCRSS